MTLRIIGLAGRKGSGKSYVALLAEEAVVRDHKRSHRRNKLYVVTKSFAAPVKEMLEALPFDQDEIEARLYGDMKEEPEHLILSGMSMRDAMQTLATIWGRGLNPNIWLDCMRQALLEVERVDDADNRIVIIDDVRFENEVAFIKSLRGVVLAVRSDTEETGYAHVSEQLDLGQFASITNNRASAGNLAKQLTDLTPYSFTAAS